MKAVGPEPARYRSRSQLQSGADPVSRLISPESILSFKQPEFALFHTPAPFRWGAETAFRSEDDLVRTRRSGSEGHEVEGSVEACRIRAVRPQPEAGEVAPCRPHDMGWGETTGCVVVEGAVMILAVLVAIVPRPQISARARGRLSCG